jgi:hypothetical protein
MNYQERKKKSLIKKNWLGISELSSDTKKKAKIKDKINMKEIINVSYQQPVEEHVVHRY